MPDPVLVSWVCFRVTESQPRTVLRHGVFTLDEPFLTPNRYRQTCKDILVVCALLPLHGCCPCSSQLPTESDRLQLIHKSQREDSEPFKSGVYYVEYPHYQCLNGNVTDIRHFFVTICP